VGEVVIDQPGRTDMMEFIPDPEKMRRFMAPAIRMNNAVSIGLAGREVGRIDEGDIFYPLVVRSPNPPHQSRDVECSSSAQRRPVRCCGVGQRGQMGTQAVSQRHYSRAGQPP
jgi:hypothetical protein